MNPAKLNEAGAARQAQSGGGAGHIIGPGAGLWIVVLLFARLAGIHAALFASRQMSAPTELDEGRHGAETG
jgi:hypothetical protein